MFRQRACVTHPSVRPGAIQSGREGTAQRLIHSRGLRRTKSTQSRGEKVPGAKWIFPWVPKKPKNVNADAPQKPPKKVGVKETRHAGIGSSSAPVTLMS